MIQSGAAKTVPRNLGPDSFPRGGGPVSDRAPVTSGLPDKQTCSVSTSMLPCKSPRGDGLDCRAPVKSRDFDAPATSTLRNAQNLSRVEPTVPRAAGSERWGQEQIRPERLAVRAADRALDSASRANRISMFLRSRRDCSKVSVPAKERGIPRAVSANALMSARGQTEKYSARADVFRFSSNSGRRFSALKGVTRIAEL